jgi:glycosyltransferase involved in cell wall biosynthesis
MPGPKAILFLHHGQDWIRGSERVLLDLAGNLPRERFRPLVWCDSPALRVACAEAGIETVGRKLLPTKRPWWRVERSVIAEMLSVIEAQDVALLHANTLECLPQSIRAGKSARIPVVAHLHLPTNLDERVWSGLHQAMMTVGVSEFSLSWVEADGFERGPTRLIYNAIFPQRLELGNASGLRERFGIAADSFVVVTIGSLIALKDTATIIEAVSRLAKAGRDVHLLVVGGGELDTSMRRLTSSLGLDGRVHFLGDRDDVGAILRDAADALVSASRSEALGLNVLEAGYFGVPSIVSAIPAHREIIERSGGGLLFEVGRSEDLAAKLEQLVGDPGYRNELGARAKRFVQERFLPDRFLREFSLLYDELLQVSRSRLGWLHGFSFPRCYWSFGWAALNRQRGRSAHTER